MAEAVAVKKDWWSAVAAYLTPRMLIILAMGFASGLPLLLTLSTLSYWLSKVGVDKTTIGLFALVGTPYTFKFLWSPIMDQVPLPVLTRLLGRRRSWLLLTQVLLAVAIFVMGQIDPARRSLDDRAGRLHHRLPVRQPGHCHRCLSHRTACPQDEQGHGAAATQIGYRFGLLARRRGRARPCRTSFPGRLSSACSVAAGWSWPIIVTLAGARAEGLDPACTASATIAQWVKEAMIDPFAEFMSRTGLGRHPAVRAVLQIRRCARRHDGQSLLCGDGLYRPGVASVSKVWGVWMTVVGALIGGIAVARWGVFRALLIGGILQAVTNFAFAYVAIKGVPISGLSAKAPWCPIRTHVDELACRSIRMTCSRWPAPSRPTILPAALRARRSSLICPASAMSPSPPRNTPC